MSRPKPDTDLDPDWAPQIPSIWDVEDESDEPEPLSSEDPFAPPFEMARPRSEWLDPRNWAEAGHGAGAAMVHAAEATARLDERLRRQPEAQRAAWRERLALEDISALLWAEGARLRAETLALAGADRIGRPQDTDHLMARAEWARRRLAGQGSLRHDPDGLADFLGRLPKSGADEVPAWEALPEALIPAAPDVRAAADWCTGMAALADAHPLVRAAAGFHLWRGLGLSEDTWLEPGVVAARLGAQEMRGGLLALPLMSGSGRALVRPGGTAAERLETWLSGLVRAADRAQMMLDRVEAWRDRAAEQAKGMKGKGAPALIALLTARPILSAGDAASALGITAVQARNLLNRLSKLGLTRELTGHTRFRFWTAAI